jgi:ABC-type amino acid transport system permease subunit
VSFKATEIYFTLAVIYLLVVWSLSALIRFVESRLALPENA